jgi:kynureninase
MLILPGAVININSGPGNAGMFVHMKTIIQLPPRFELVGGHNKERRFKMEPTFDPC